MIDILQEQVEHKRAAKLLAQLLKKFYSQRLLDTILLTFLVLFVSRILLWHPYTSDLAIPSLLLGLTLLFLFVR